MRLLHTADWHVGKSMRGLSRADEHRAVLGEIVDLTEEHTVDVVVIAGDIFESSAPSPEAEAIVYGTLLDLSQRGVAVVAVAGNHDNARRLDAISPVFAITGVHIAALPRPPTEGGVLRIDAGSSSAAFALLPFVSQRGIVRADHLMSDAAFEHVQSYADRMSNLIRVLVESCPADIPTVVVHHGFVTGGTVGGGERLAHLMNAYHVPALAFAPSIAYVALGHLHRAQKIPGAAPIYYPGSPLMLDFGDTDDEKSVTLVDIPDAGPAKVRQIALASGRPLRTVRGTIDQILSTTVEGDPWLRFIVEGARSADLAKDVRAHFGERAVEVRVETQYREDQLSRTDRARNPHELFAEYAETQGLADPLVEELFSELYDLAATAGDPASEADRYAPSEIRP